MLPNHQATQPETPKFDPDDARTWTDEDLELMRLCDPKPIPEAELRGLVKDALQRRGLRADENAIENAISDEDFHRECGSFES
jgi:hypothetical protein